MIKRQAKRMLLVLTAILTVAAQAVAQTDDEQVLIFRNTGEINLLFTSEIDSIVCSRLDADSVMHDDVVTQVFHTADTVLAVPVAEIDSVTFGSRNGTVVKDGVRMMTASDSTWIIRYDGSNVYYRADTPSGILPREGEKLFYGKADRLFPVGLAAVVKSVKTGNGEYIVNVGDIDLSDIFDRLFFAGRIENPDAPARNGRKAAQVDKHTSLSVDFNIGENLSINGKDEFGINGRVVADALRGFFSLEADVSNDFELVTKAKIERSAEITEEHNLITLPLGVYALVFTPELKFDAFASINAELSANLRYQRNSNLHVSYMREGWGKEPVMNVTNPNGEDSGTQSQIDLTCKGEFYTGVQTTFDLNILRETTGARIKLRLGPAFESEFGLGVLDKTERYDPEIYAKAELSSSMKLWAEASLYIRDKLVWGNEKETQLFTFEHKFLKRKLDLFPKFASTKAVSIEEAANAKVSVATKSGNDIMRDVETGFRIENDRDEVVDSVFVGTITSGSTDVQGLSAEIDITGKVSPENRKTLRVRPVFHYAGRTVAARHASLMSDMMLQPMVFGQTNGAVTYLSGMPFSGSVVKDSTLYTAGPYLPVPVCDTVFIKHGPTGTGIFIDDMLSARLTGTWSGTEAGRTVIYVFKADGTGQMTGASVDSSSKTFSYVLNSPQSGRIALRFDNGNNVKVLSVANISETVLQYRIPGDTALYTLNRQ